MQSEAYSSEPEYTILGASGFIGSNLVTQMREAHLRFYAPQREAPEILERPLGHVVYCIGMTADWRSRPYETVHAHVEYLLKVLERSTFKSLLYLSSTRLYKRVDVATEETPIAACPHIKDDLFDISKMMGESLCLTASSNVRVVRLSNVYGSDYASQNFLSSVIRDSLRGRVVLESNPQSAKDYIGIDEVVRLLPRIAVSGKHRIYNIASGRNTTHAQILAALAQETGCKVETDSGARTVSFPPISTKRIGEEFEFSARSVIEAIGPLVEVFRRDRNHWEDT